MRRAVAVVLDADLERDGALSHGRHHDLGRNGRGDAISEAEPLQARAGQERCVGNAVFELFQAGLHVAAKIYDLEVGPRAAHLRLAPERRGADDRALGQRIEREHTSRR